MDWGIIGHEWAVNLLAQHVAQGRERHAYLITGPQGVGRRTLGLRFIQSLNCLKPPAPGQPCLKCSNCKRIELMQHPDLLVVEAEHEGQVLRIDQVRDLLHNLAFTPYEARYRVALILRFEEAHTSSANALLKTLEEPPAQVVLVLTAKSVETLLPTIVSRCEVIRLRPLSVEETAKGLQAVRGVTSDVAIKLAHISGGRPGYAIRLYQQPGLLEQRYSWIEQLIQLLASSRRERFAYALSASKMDNRDILHEELQVWLTFWRDVLISATKLTDSISNLDYSAPIKKLADEIGLLHAESYVESIERTLEQINKNINVRLALEVLLLDFPHINISG